MEDTATDHFLVGAHVIHRGFVIGSSIPIILSPIAFLGKSVIRYIKGKKEARDLAKRSKPVSSLNYDTLSAQRKWRYWLPSESATRSTLTDRSLLTRLTRSTIGRSVSLVGGRSVLLGSFISTAGAFMLGSKYVSGAFDGEGAVRERRIRIMQNEAMGSELKMALGTTWLGGIVGAALAVGTGPAGVAVAAAKGVAISNGLLGISTALRSKASMPDTSH